MGFVIVTDSASDTEAQITSREDVFVVPTIIIQEQQEYLDFELPISKLLDYLAEGKFPTTSQPSPDQFNRIYHQAAELELPVLGIHISSKLSGTYNGANLIAKNIEGLDVEIFDTHNISAGAGYFVKMAAELRDRGYTRDQVLEVFSHIRDQVHLEIVIGNIEYLKRGGRVNLGQYWLLKILRLCPVITNSDGILIRKSITRGGKNGVNKIINRILRYQYPNDSRIFVLGHVTTPKLVEEMKARIDGITHQDQYTQVISSTLLSHVGPDAFGIMVGPSLNLLVQFFED